MEWKYNLQKTFINLQLRNQVINENYRTRKYIHECFNF